MANAFLFLLAVAFKQNGRWWWDLLIDISCVAYKEEITEQCLAQDWFRKIVLSFILFTWDEWQVKAC